MTTIIVLSAIVVCVYVVFTVWSLDKRLKNAEDAANHRPKFEVKQTTGEE